MKVKITFKFKGNSESIVINHEEQYFLPDLRKRKVFGFAASDDEIRNFLSEEEYFDLVVLAFNNKTINLIDVKRIKFDKKNDEVHIGLSFKSAR
jgi:hypothetical protein